MVNVTYSEAKISNLEEIAELFRNTIKTVNIKDYSPQEIEAWSSGADYTENWIKRIETHYYLIARSQNKIIGMASIENNGYLDVMYVHHQHQGLGVATNLLNKMIEKAKSIGLYKITSDVSITAKPFFIHKGFQLVRPQLVLCRGVVLRNYHVKLIIN